MTTQELIDALAAYSINATADQVRKQVGKTDDLTIADVPAIAEGWQVSAVAKRRKSGIEKPATAQSEASQSESGHQLPQVQNSMLDAASQILEQMQQQVVSRAEDQLYDFFLGGGFQARLGERLIPILAEFTARIPISASVDSGTPATALKSAEPPDFGG